MNNTITAESIKEILTREGSHKVKVAIVDMDGILRGKYLHIDKFLSALKSGFGFCSVILGWDSSDNCYDNVKFTGWHTGYPDVNAKIDIQTFRKIPWNENVPFFLADFTAEDGSPLDICPRNMLKKIVQRLEGHGYKARVGCEYEWFNFKENPESLVEKNFANLTPLTPGMYGYSILRSSLHKGFFDDLIDKMAQFRIPLEGLHTETGPGVYEAAIMHAEPVEAADRAVLFKTGAKEIANKHQLIASFMARWNTALPGCSGHLHESLSYLDGRPAFFEAHDPYRMSRVFQSFLAGQLKYIPELLSMMAPTVNSYKRLVEGFWAPTSATWGIDNRTCALRVIPGSASSTRVEVRVPGADMNPYLAIAASLGAGLLGIEENLPLTQKNVQGNGYAVTDATPFPRNLQQSAEALSKSSAAVKLFGENFVNHYSETRSWEWRQSQKAVTDWELQRYFEII